MQGQNTHNIVRKHSYVHEVGYHEEDHLRFLSLY